MLVHNPINQWKDTIWTSEKTEIQSMGKKIAKKRRQRYIDEDTIYGEN